MTKIIFQKLRAKSNTSLGKATFSTTQYWHINEGSNSNSLESNLSTHLCMDRNKCKGTSFDKGAIKKQSNQSASNIILLYSFQRRYCLMVLNIISLSNSLEIPAGFLRQFQQNKKVKTHWKLTLPLPIRYSCSISFPPRAIYVEN